MNLVTNLQNFSFYDERPVSLLRLIFILPLILFTIGCQQSANKTLIKVPAHWPNSAFRNNSLVDLAHFYWWQQFNNTELNNLMHKVLIQNNELKISLTKVEQAQSQLEQIKLSWLPGLNFLAGYSQFPNLGNPGAIAIAYPTYIINLLQLYKRQQSAKALYTASIFATEGVKIALIARTAASFFILLEQIDSLKLTQQFLKDSQGFLAVLNTQFNSGLIPLDAVIEQKSKIKLIQAQINIIQYNITVSNNALRYLCNEDPGSISIKSTLSELNPKAIIPGNQPVSVLANRPDIREAASLLRASFANTEALKATFFPEINLGAYLGTSGAGSIKLGQAYAAGPIIELPLFAQIKGAKARDKEHFIRYVDTIKRALRDVANDLAAYNAFAQQLNVNSKALADTEQQCRMVQIRYKHGLEDALVPLRCRIALDELSLIVSRNKLEKLMALVTLYQDLGGGYSG